MAGGERDGGPVARPQRSQRRRLETRGKLLDAARNVMAEKGIDLATIAEIADAADVGFGSFYNHFGSKEEIAACVVERELGALQHAIDRLTHSVDDPAIALAVAISTLFRHVGNDALLGLFLVRAATSVPQMKERIRKRMGLYVGPGARSGRFAVLDDDVAAEVAGLAIFATLRFSIDSPASDDPEASAIDLVLRMLGVSGDEVRAIADDLPKTIQRLRREAAGEEPQGSRP